MRRELVLLLGCLLLAGCGNGSTPPRDSVVPSATASQAPGPMASTPSAPISPTVAPTLATSPKPSADSAGGPWQLADMSSAIPLVSKRFRLPASYVPKSSGSYGLTSETNIAIDKLIAAAHSDGVSMQVRSGYRSYATQKAAYETALRSYSSPAEAMRYNAPPGASEHQTGLSADMWDGKNRGYAFRGTATDKWLSANAYRFGFILRYPKGKEAITGYMDEPWHLRYVGIDVAAKFGPANSLTLEEYLGVK